MWLDVLPDLSDGEESDEALGDWSKISLIFQQHVGLFHGPKGRRVWGLLLSWLLAERGIGSTGAWATVCM